MAKDRPWLKFYAETWLADPHLRLCDASARGVLIDLMSLAHFGSPYGYVTNGKKALTDKEIPDALRIPWQTWRKSKASLLEHHRLEYDEDRDALFIPRMVRDGVKSDKARMYGLQGGNPALVSPGEDLFGTFIEQIWKEEKKKAKKSAKIIAQLWQMARKKLSDKQLAEMEELINDWKKNGRPGRKA